ncbi:MAG TPA: hypothetical protein VFV99_28075 [Kofleriaceae bacterium]|nr:hypothetical protein [Kofleriaceae bacterium]
MATIACIGEPISWLRLERYALAGATEPTIRAHVEACAACRQCLDEIQRDVVALPPLHVSVTKRRRWWTLALPAFGALAAAAILLLVLRPREPKQADNIVRIKGVGEVIVDVVRERGGVVREDVRSYQAGDRWKVVVTCPPTHEVSLAVAVREDGAEHADRPLAPAKILCGNRIYVPGAFELTGGKPHRVCVRIEDQADACLTLAPE